MGRQSQVVLGTIANVLHSGLTGKTHGKKIGLAGVGHPILRKTEPRHKEAQRGRDDHAHSHLAGSVLRAYYTRALQPSNCKTWSPAFQSLTYITPSVVTNTSADFAARLTLGRGSISFAGCGGTQ